MAAPITSIYAALLALMLLALAGRVVRVRLGQGIGLGTGGSDEMERRIRVHGNLTEYAPIFLVLLLLSELAHAPVWLLHGTGVAFVVARTLHAVGLSRERGRSFGRVFGSVVSWTAIVVLALYLLARAAGA
jgi:uncharacterized membrane protein YecN with MAPEG domain